MSEKQVDWATILKMTVLGLVLANLIGFCFWVAFKCGVNWDTPSILTSRGYTHIDVWGLDRLNCPRGYVGTRFNAKSNDKRLSGVVCTEIYSDSVFVRIMDEY